MASGVFCPSCGSPAPPGARFCANCGSALNAASPSQPEPQPAGQPSQWGDPPRTGRNQPGVAAAARQGFGWAFGCLILGIVVVVVLLALAWWGSNVSTPSEGGPIVTISASPGAVPSSGGATDQATLSAPAAGGATGSATLSGTDDQTGPPFTLSGGDYVLTWSATGTRDRIASPFGVLVMDADNILGYLVGRHLDPSRSEAVRHGVFLRSGRWRTPLQDPHQRHDLAGLDRAALTVVGRSPTGEEYARRDARSRPAATGRPAR